MGRAELLNDLDISLKARILLEDDPEGHFKSNHSINCLDDLNITLNRIDEKHDHSHSTIASKEFTRLQYYSTEFTRLISHGPSNIHESLINGNDAFILGISMTFTETNDSVTSFSKSVISRNESTKKLVDAHYCRRTWNICR